MQTTEVNFWTKERLENLSPNDAKRFTAKLKEGVLYDEDMPIHLAEKLTVKFRGVRRTLKWLVRHQPARLESMMDTMEPGSVLFNGLTVVYNHPPHQARILAAVKVANDRIQGACIEGLKRYHQPMKVRPTTHRRRLFLLPERIAEMVA